MTPTWATPQHSRVIGAAHRRQGRPCQDASLSMQGLDPEGERLQLMAVADGHGGSRYWLSDVGSRLACEQAAAAIRERLKIRSLAAAGWQDWLENELPNRVQRQWLQAIEADWSQRQEANTAPFSPLTYGTTLGLVLMNRHWWAVGGLGDWDLMVVPVNGPPELLNQETDLGGGGEATASLCLEEAGSLWQQRCQFIRCDPGGPPFALLLSTDGLRKSCATDEDYRVLGAYLCGLTPSQPGSAAGPVAESTSDGTVDGSGDGLVGSATTCAPADLEGALARITSEGSGDDISVAIGRWPAADTDASAETDGRADVDVDVDPNDNGNGDGDSAAAEATPITPVSIDPSPGIKPALPGKAWRRPRLLVGALGVVTALGVIALVRQPQPPTADPAVSSPAATPAEVEIGAEGQAALQQKVAVLCSADSATRRATLRNRRSQFEGLNDGTIQRSLLLTQAAEDPLGALIAWSQPHATAQATASAPHQSSIAQTAISQTAITQAVTPQTGSPRSTPPQMQPPTGWPVTCPELDQELRRQWQSISPATPTNQPAAINPPSPSPQP